MRRLGQFLLAAPGSVLTLFILLVLLAVYPASRIQTDFNLEGFFPKDDPVLIQFEELGKEFGEDDTVILTGFQTDSLFSQSVLSAIRSITESLENIPYVEEVQSLTNASNIENRDGFLSFNEYIRSDIPEEISDEWIQEITSDPFLSGSLVSKDGTATAIALTIQTEENTYTNRNEIIRGLEEVINPYRDRFQFHISGIPHYRNQYVNMLNKEIIGYIAISSVLIILLLWYLYRSIWGILFPMIIVWTTLLLTVALMQLTGGYLEIMSSTIAPILLCVGVADAIHMISKFDDARVSGLSRSESILEMLMTLGMATLMTSVTTAIGFASLISSSVVPMKKFGFYTAAGVMIAYLITIIILPVMLRRTRREKVFHQEKASVNQWIDRLLGHIARINRMYYKRVLFFSGLMVLFISYFIGNVQVNGRVFDDIRDDTQIMRDQAFFQETISPQLSVELVLDTEEPEGIIHPERLRDMIELEKYLLQIPEIERVTGLHTLLAEVHKVMRPERSPKLEGELETDPELNITPVTHDPGTPLRLDQLPDNGPAIAQYLLLLEMNSADALFRLTDFDFQKTRIRAFLPDLGSDRINEIREQMETELAGTFPELDISITGTTILSANLTNKIVYSLLWSILIAVGAISVIMAFLFRSPIMVLISMVPNLMPLLVTAGVMGLSGVDIKPSTAVIFTIALGIAVDDSIHFLSRFRLEFARSGVMSKALTMTTLRTGRPMIITSLILIAGFGTLMNSDFTSTTMMGILVCSTIFAALTADLLVLPSLFYWIKPSIERPTLIHQTHQSMEAHLIDRKMSHETTMEGEASLPELQS